MRVLFAAGLLIMVALWAERAAAEPLSGRANAVEEAELHRLEQQLYAEQLAQRQVAAAKTARWLYELTSKIYGANAIETRGRLAPLAMLLEQIGDHRGALAALEKNLAFIAAGAGPDSREMLVALTTLPFQFVALGRYDEAVETIERALALSKKLDGESSSSHVAVLQTYGQLLQLRNEHAAAASVFEECARVSARPGKSPEDLFPHLLVLGGAYVQAGQLEKALEVYGRAARTLSNPSSQQLAQSALGITSASLSFAVRSKKLGREGLARPRLLDAVARIMPLIAHLEQAAPADTMLSTLIQMAASVHRWLGDLATTETLLRRVMELDEKQGRPSGARTSVALLRWSAGERADALALLEHDQPRLSESVRAAHAVLIADLLRELGEAQRAEKVLEAAVRESERLQRNRDPYYPYLKLGLLRVHLASKRLRGAERILGEYLEREEEELERVLENATVESDHALYFGRRNPVDLVASVQLLHAPNSVALSRFGLTTLLRRKGRQLDAAAVTVQSVRSALSPADRASLDELTNARSMLAKLVVLGPKATEQGRFAGEVRALEEKIQKLEVTVAGKSAAYRTKIQRVELRAVQRLIPADARLVEIVNFEAADPLAPFSLSVVPSRRYAAYVLGRTGEPSFIDLGPENAIDAAVGALRKALANPANPRVHALGRDLHALTMAKIEPALGPVTRVIVSPDGALNLVPFAALVDAQQRFSIERFTFTYLTSGRDLLRPKNQPGARSGSVLFAEPSFNASVPSARARRGRLSEELAGLSWGPLPGTGDEANAIAQRLQGVQVLRGEAATESALKAIRGPEILHLATHGFFLPDQRSQTPGGWASTMLDPPSVGSFENPLLRSGLVFAGANQRASGDDDGILTALEASGLDLSGTKLVVLSACETGVGEASNGDGVYGLRRAFVIAGAESLVMSLWQVDDLATKELMTGYYGKLARGQSRASALREVQRELVANPRYAHPYYWAAFLGLGDDSPMRR